MIERLSARRRMAGSFADEIGIEIGIYGDWRLKAAFRPVFARAGNGFRAVAVEGSTRPYVLGREIADGVFRAIVPARDRPIVAGLQVALCMRNLEHTGVDGLKLLIGSALVQPIAPDSARAGVRALAAQARRCGLPPSQLVVQLSPLAAIDPDIAALAERELNNRGVLVALEENGEGLALNGLPQSTFPDLVTVDPVWFGSIARQRPAARLFAALVEAYRWRGAIVLVQGINNAAELDVAIDSGADWLSGPMLAPTALAGAIFPDGTLHISSLLDQRRVIPLFR
jgi:EAL domain-containing protein (putative c-di-GMP-specific phosphodiesterase class I)